MHNLKRFHGTGKGLIGEYMFKITRKNLILNRISSKEGCIKAFSDYFTEEQKLFLGQNWFSIDAIEIDEENKAAILYEIKTRNGYSKSLRFRPKMTLSTHNIYNQAKKLGFKVKLAMVYFYYNWDYDIEILEFDKKYYHIDKPKRFDKQVVSGCRKI